MIKSEKVKSSIQFIAIYLVLMASAGYYFLTMSQTVCYVVLSIAAILMLVARGRMAFDSRMLCVCMILGALGLISSVLAADSYEYTLLPLISLMLAMLIMSSIERSRFERLFLNVMLMIAIAAIVSEVIYLLAPGIIKMFPAVVNKAGASANNLWITVVASSYGGIHRVQGIFWEPGVFQIFLSFALLILWSNRGTENIKHFKLKMIVFIIAMVMTFSTTAYMLLALFALLIMKNSPQKNKMLIISAIIVFAFLFAITFITPVRNIFIDIVFNKVSEFFKAFSGGSSENVSSQVRSDAIIYPFLLFLQNPVLGAGYNGLFGLGNVMGHTMTTCTPINYFALYGFAYGAIIIWLFYRLAKYFADKLSDALLIFVILLMMVVSEDMVALLSFNMFLLLGLKKEKRKMPIIVKTAKAEK